MTPRESECASCERVRPLYVRGLCKGCHSRHFCDGTLTEYGYVKADRMADYARLRAWGTTVAAAAARLGVCRRTAQRYERELAASGRAPWRRWGVRLRAA